MFLDFGHESDYPKVSHGLMQSLDANSDSTSNQSKFAPCHIFYPFFSRTATVTVILSKELNFLNLYVT